MRVSDRASGLALAALGGLAILGGTRQPGVPGQDVGPAVFPVVIGAGLVLCGALVAFGVGRGFEDDAPRVVAAAPDAAAPAPPPRGPVYGLRALLPVALLLFYVLAAERLGFLPTAALMVATLALALGASWRLAVPLALGAPLLAHLAFAKLLRVPLPDGLVPAPW